MEVRTRLAAGLDLVGHGVGGERDDRGAPGAKAQLGGADLAGGGEAVHHRHLGVHQHDVERTLIEEGLHRLRAVLGDDDVGMRPQHQLDDLAIYGVIFGQKDAEPLVRQSRGDWLFFHFNRSRGLGDLQRGAERERRSLSRSRFAADLAAHHLRQGPDDGQAQARAAELAGDGAVALFEPAEQPGADLLREAGSGIPDRHLQGGPAVARGRGAGVDEHLPLVRELDRIADQVGDDLADAQGIADQPVHLAGVDDHLEVQALATRRRLEQVGRGADRFAQAERLGLELQLAGLRLGQVQHVAEDRRQRFAGGDDHPDNLALLRRQVHGRQGVGQAEHAVQGRADLVAHVGEELALGDVGRFGVGERLLQRVFGELAVCHVLGDRQEIGPTVGIADTDFLLAQEAHAFGGCDRLGVEHLNLAGLQDYAVQLRRAPRFFGRKDFAAGLAQVLAPSHAVHLLDCGVGHHDPPIGGVLDREAGRHVLDDRLQERFGPLQLFGGPLSLGDVVRDRQDVGRAVGRTDRDLHLPQNAHAVARRRDGGVLLDQ